MPNNAEPSPAVQALRALLLAAAIAIAVGGVLAWWLIKRWSYVDGYIVLLPLTIGACVGWLSAQMVGPFAAENWSAVSSTVTLPAALFIIIPAIKVVQEQL